MNNARDINAVRFAIVASAMTNSGAWAKSLGGVPQNETDAREDFRLRVGFHYPDRPYWAPALTLYRVTGTNREIIAERK